jgi:threonine aldolase
MSNESFGSDNHSGVHPEILKAMEKVNEGFTIAYGDDKFTKGAIEKFYEHFGRNIDVYFLYNGTATNILGLKAVVESFNSIICAETAHLNVHECCGPEKFIGCKLTTIKTSDGKLTVEKIKPYLTGFGDPHVAQPKVISITQPTELGTLYTVKEIKNLADFVHKNKMLLHVDGARLSNAAAALNLSFKEITKDVGVALLSFGGTKNGMMFGEAVVFFDRKLSKNFEYIRKQGMQLASKMRYISAQFDAFLSNDLWLKNAKHANDMAKLLYEKIRDIPGIKVTQKVECNAVFVMIPKKYIPIIQRKYFFHVFDEKNSIARLMCSYNTSGNDVSGLADAIRKTIVVK